MTQAQVTALIVAAGSGARLGGGLPKQYRPIAGKPVLRHAVEALVGHPRVDAVRVVVAADHHQLAATALGGLDIGDFISGGSERADSVRNGLAAIHDGIVLVHDAARPFCPPEVVDRLLDALGGNPGAVPVLPVSDTLARARDTLGEPIDRTGAVRVQTPQAFHANALRAAFARWNGPSPTDEASVARAAGLSVAAVEGSEMLDKLTTASDWERVENRLAARLVGRTGMGFDVHAFAGDGPLIMGGIAIPHPRGLAGHSDADVVLHAVTDALLGAAGLGDIGEHFPPSDPRWEGAASALFLAHAAQLIRDRGGIIDHVDCTVIAEEPKVGRHRSGMRDKVAEILGVTSDQVSIKATTTERLGFTGRREGIAAQAVATIRMPAVG
jgi:2-C-methyl-D-erythritol 4-phosphate cytidylyltransferase / 2-C-methyl-D-erythritol 2,4-cyclodiphosphate synthase